MFAMIPSYGAARGERALWRSCGGPSHQGGRCVSTPCSAICSLAVLSPCCTLRIDGDHVAVRLGDRIATARDHRRPHCATARKSVAGARTSRSDAPAAAGSGGALPADPACQPIRFDRLIMNLPPIARRLSRISGVSGSACGLPHRMRSSSTLPGFGSFAAFVEAESQRGHSAAE